MSTPSNSAYNQSSYRAFLKLASTRISLRDCESSEYEFVELD
jgi:hypothetical protein